MDFNESYQLLSFKTFLDADEENERHLLHECGHKWLGVQYGVEFVGMELNPGGVSRTFLCNIGSIEQYYEIGVAGMLAEAKGIQQEWDEHCCLDIDRMPKLANELYRVLHNCDPKKDAPLYPDVPMSCRIPSTMWAELSVSDLQVPIEQKLNEKLLEVSLVTVSKKFNTDEQWNDFLEMVKANRK